MDPVVFVEKCLSYKEEDVVQSISSFRNIFQQTISQGNTVLLKPNWIAPHHRYKKDEWEAVITNPAIITQVLKESVTALKGCGKIIIADGPQTDSSFKEILSRMPVSEWSRICSSNGIEFEIIDFRDHEWLEKGEVVIHRNTLTGDPNGSILFDLGKYSEFENHIYSESGYYGADYDTTETNEAHRPGKHLYKLSKSAFLADVFVNIPKLKTHKKAGITCSLKNIVGINTFKNYLPHYSIGTPSTCGDEFPNNNFKNAIESKLVVTFKKIAGKLEGIFLYPMMLLKKMGRIIFGSTSETIRGGNWSGNDTLWRMVIDLNKVLFYGNSSGIIGSDNIESKKYITVVDAVIAGQGNGPEAPDPVEFGFILAGSNPVAVDCVASHLMGFNYTKIPVLEKAFHLSTLPLVDFEHKDITINSATLPEAHGKLEDLPINAENKFRPSIGWVDQL